MRSLGAKIDCSTIESVTYPGNPSFGCSNEIALSRAERPVDRNSIGPVAVAGQDSELDGNGNRPQDARSVSERDIGELCKGNRRCTTASRGVSSVGCGGVSSRPAAIYLPSLARY